MWSSATWYYPPMHYTERYGIIVIFYYHQLQQVLPYHCRPDDCREALSDCHQQVCQKSFISISYYEPWSHLTKLPKVEAIATCYGGMGEKGHHFVVPTRGTLPTWAVTWCVFAMKSQGAPNTPHCWLLEPTYQVILVQVSPCDRVPSWWLYMAARLEHQAAQTMSWYPPLSHCSEIEPYITIVPTAWLWSEKYSLLSH